MHGQSITSESIEMYLKSICELEVLDSPVAISQLAQRLGISSPSVVEMVKRLVEQELVDHTPYKGVSLTEKGAKRANQILRRHRLWECFLTDKLGLPWAGVHDFACRLEHATAPEVTNALAEFLGHPTTCPHGNPIPRPDGQVTQPDTVPLTELEIGDTTRLVNIAYEELVLLDYLARHGFFPGVSITIDDIVPFQGPLMIRFDDQEDQIEALGQEIAARIFVERPADHKS